MMWSVMILSGAGLSAESGLKTFRDSDGLWEEYDVMEVCSVEGFAKDPKKVGDFYDARRAQLERVEPNFAHKKIAELKEKYPREISVVTQNVDDLLERAGCKEVIHLHGTLTDLRCEVCGNIWKVGYESQEGKSCQKCGSKKIRHNVVMFGEPAPMYGYLDDLFSGIELFIVIGSSGNVLPLKSMAKYKEKSVLNNLHPEPDLDRSFQTVIHKKASEGILEIEKMVEDFLCE
jgi:NAD-dependent deacetylase